VAGSIDRANSSPGVRAAPFVIPPWASRGGSKDACPLKGKWKKPVEVCETPGPVARPPPRTIRNSAAPRSKAPKRPAGPPHLTLLRPREKNQKTGKPRRCFFIARQASPRPAEGRGGGPFASREQIEKVRRPAEWTIFFHFQTSFSLERNFREPETQWSSMALRRHMQFIAFNNT